MTNATVVAIYLLVGWLIVEGCAYVERLEGRSPMRKAEMLWLWLGYPFLLVLLMLRRLLR